MEDLLKQIINKLDNMEKDIHEIKFDLKDVKQQVTAINGQTTDLTKFRTETRTELTHISDKVDAVQIDVNNLTAKVAYSDNKILEFSKYIKNVK